MQDRPTAAELLAAIADLLEVDLLPALPPAMQHRARVAGNLARILERETRLGTRLLLEERDLLVGLLLTPDGLTAQDLLPGPLAEQVADLNQQLVDELGRQPSDTRADAIWAALFAIAKGKLAIAKPGYDAYDARAELPAAAPAAQGVQGMPAP
jgi:hypothetical protein